MKKRCLILATFCCMLGFLIACQDDHSVSKTSESVDPNLKTAQKNLDDFIRFMEPNTKSSENGLAITGVAKKSLPLKLRDSLVTSQTRSALAELKDSADLYTFTFVKGENTGYAIVSGEERVPKLYAYVEKGCIADTTVNGGLRQALQMVDEIYADDVLGAYVMGTRGQNSAMAYGDYTKSLTRLEWGQGAPYNRNAPMTCPITQENETGKAWAGCVPVAVGMVIAAGESIFAVQEDQVNLYNNIPRILDGDRVASPWVANFMIKIGNFCNVVYGCGGSSATADGASKALSHYWMIHQVENGLNDNWTKSSLDAGRPIIAFGTADAGHCWLLDGGIKDGSGKYTHFYNNWGYGGLDNGFFAVTDFCRYTDSKGVVHNYNKNNQFIYIFDYPK